MIYFDLLPKDILYLIIEYINDRYEINKFIKSSKCLIDLFNNDELWKEMLFINIRNPKINYDYLWMDNYFNNLNIATKYNINQNKYAVVFRKINKEDSVSERTIRNINSGFIDYAMDSSDEVIGIADSDGDLYYEKRNYDILTSLLRSLKLHLGIEFKNFISGLGPHAAHSTAIFKIDSIKFDDLNTIIYDTTNFDWLPNHDNIITLETKIGNIILLDAPNLK